MFEIASSSQMKSLPSSKVFIFNKNVTKTIYKQSKNEEEKK